MLTKRKSKKPLIVQMILKKFFFLNIHKTNNGSIVKIKIIGPFINTPTAEMSQKIILFFWFKKLSIKPLITIKLLAITVKNKKPSVLA